MEPSHFINVYNDDISGNVGFKFSNELIFDQYSHTLIMLTTKWIFVSKIHILYRHYTGIGLFQISAIYVFEISNAGQNRNEFPKAYLYWNQHSQCGFLIQSVRANHCWYMWWLSSGTWSHELMNYNEIMNWRMIGNLLLDCIGKSSKYWMVLKYNI